MGRFRRLAALFADIGGVIGLAILLSSTAIWIVATLPNDLDITSQVILIGIGLSVGLTVGGAAAAVIARRKSNAVESQRGYRWLSATFRYVVDPGDIHRHVQFAKITIEATRDGVAVFSNQYLWSGNGVDAPPTISSPGHRLLGEARRSSGWSSYYVDLGRPLRRGERTCIEIIQTLIDVDERLNPFVAKAIQERIEKLRIEVVLPPSLRPAAAWQIERDGLGPGARELTRVPSHVNAGDPTASFDIDKPKLHHNYELLWEYPHGRSIYG